MQVDRSGAARGMDNWRQIEGRPDRPRRTGLPRLRLAPVAGGVSVIDDGKGVQVKVGGKPVCV